MTLTQPTYIVLEKVQNNDQDIHCHHCNRPILHTNLIKNTITNETFYLGGTCTQNFTGKSIKVINEENEEYNEAIESALRAEASSEQRRTHIKSFIEANSEMMEYIENNTNNSFIKSMKERIEKEGTLTRNMFAVVYSMMLPVAKLDKKVKDLDFKLIRIQKKEGEYGSSFTLLGETKDKKLIRVFFSSLDKYNELLIDLGVIDKEHYFMENILDRKIMLSCSGSFDGYKIKRAKLLAVVSAVAA